MRIALVATHHAEYAANLALALAAEHDVMLILSRRNAARQLRPESMALLAQRLTLRIVPHHYAPLQPWIARVCERHVIRFAADVVHVQEHPTRSMGLLARRLNGRLPLVATVHDPSPHSGGDAAAATSFARHYAELRGRADALIAHGAVMAGALAATGIAAARIAALPHGVLRFGRLAPAPLHAQVEANRLIFFGRMEAYKGLDTLLAANRLWLERGVPIRLTVAGTGPELERHRKALAAPNIRLLAGRIPQERLETLVATSAAALLPYHDATQSGVVGSAFGAGRPVICSAVGGLPEAVGPAGLLVAPGDAQALAEAGARLVSEPALLGRLAHAAADRATGELGWSSIGKRTAALYRRLSHRTD